MQDESFLIVNDTCMAGGFSFTVADMAAPTVLILGTTGRLGSVLLQHLAPRFKICAPARAVADLGHPQELRRWLERTPFDMAINAAAITSLEVCEDEPERALRVNAESAGELAAVCAQRGARCIHFSTDYVFAGSTGSLILETEEPLPVNVYGRSKRAGEVAVLAACPDALVARVSWLFGPAGGDVPEAVLHRALKGEPLGFIEDKWSVPSSTVDISAWVERLLTDLAHVSGTLHLCNTGVATWRDYAQVTLDLAERHGLLPPHPQGGSWQTKGLRLRDFPQFRAARPPFTVMSNEKLAHLLGEAPRAWQAALESHILHLAASRNQA